ncbi:MAG: hypothetical protein KAJ24_00875 [Candidatus Aenigmarchaeota archaeon]|nr:hypothetical protein [Candidatus Aenigmarchaeota archaeon]
MDLKTVKKTLKNIDAEINSLKRKKEALVKKHGLCHQCYKISDREDNTCKKCLQQFYAMREDCRHATGKKH